MRRQEDVQLQVDGYTRVCLTAITVLLTVLVIGLWAENIDCAKEAHAETGVFRDNQAKKAIHEGRWGTSSARGKVAAAQKQTNVKLDELIKLLKSGEARVQVVQSTAVSTGGSYNAIQIKKD
jgi:hypothetical protein